jgi:hypothetical protein
LFLEESILTDHITIFRNSALLILFSGLKVQSEYQSTIHLFLITSIAEEYLCALESEKFHAETIVVAVKLRTVAEIKICFKFIVFLLNCKLASIIGKCFPKSRRKYIFYALGLIYFI